MGQSNGLASKIKIDVVPELREFLPQYLQNRQKDLETFKNCLQKEDVSAIKALSHKIKGHAKSYGFTDLSGICAQMETAAQTQDWSLITKLIDSYDQYLARVELPEVK